MLCFLDSASAPSSAGDRDASPRGWNSDDERDYEDQQYSPPSPMAYYPGSQNPLTCFMADMPDWNDFDKRALDNALQGLPVPDSRPAPPGISLQDAIKVHHILKANNRIEYRIRHRIRHIRYRIRCLIRCHDAGWACAAFRARGGVWYHHRVFVYVHHFVSSQSPLKTRATQLPGHTLTDDLQRCSHRFECILPL